MSGHPQQETQLFKMSDDFKHLITFLPPHSAYETLDLKPQALIQELEYAINTAHRPEQRTELQRLDDKRRFKPFLALLEQVVQDWRLKKFINQTLAFLPPDSEAVQELYAEEDGLNKRDRKETKAATLTDSLIQPFKLDGNLKTVLIMSLQDAFDATEPAQKATPTASAKLDPAEDINKLEFEISRYSAEHQTALEKLNRAEEMTPFLQKLNSISKKDSFVAKITEMLLLSLQLAIFPASPASSQKNAIKLPPLSNSGPDPDDGLYEYVGHDLHEVPLDLLFPAYGDLGTPSQPIMGTNAAQQVPPGDPTPSADGKPSGRYTQPGSVARRISFTSNIGQLSASNTNPPAPGKKPLEEEMPLLPTSAINPPK
jgi:hypothetical protein